ncbi:MAG: flagellar filament capping protein FliD [Bryobacteraceae bacterium]|jgi:flagellar hook-associated protein 2
MGSVSSTPASNTLTFTGSSTYAADFQNVLNRAVSLASLPLQAMQTAVTSLQSQESTLAGLNANFSALQTALQAVGTATQGSSTAQSSDPSAVSATVSSGALNGTYTIQVDSVGSSTTALSAAGLTTVTDPTTGNISSSSNFTLTVNGVATSIVPSGSSLESLAAAINAASDGVQATIVNVGSNTSPDYRLAVTSSNLGADTIQLNDGTNNLLNTLSAGTDAAYKVNPVNGTGTEIQSTSSQITLSPGLTVNLLQPTTSPATITVSADNSALSSALSNFASAYNAAVSALNQQRGQAGGALTGQSLVYALTDVLNSISTYTGGSGSVGSLADLGLTLDSSGNGNLDFSASAFAAANPTAIQQFLGNVSSSGFLQSANNALTAMTDPSTGVLQADGTALQTQIASENSQIAAQQTVITDLETNLQAQLSQADAAIATLQAQTSYYTQLFNVEYGNSNGTMSGG